MVCAGGGLGCCWGAGRLWVRLCGIKLANLRTKEEHVDKSTALRQLLYVGAQDYVLELYGSGRISLT